MRPNPLACLSLLIAALPALAEEPGWKTTCADDGSRCTAILGLTATDSGKSLGSIGLQLGRGGTDPVLVAFTPLGVALEPGFRAVIGDQAFPAPFQVCYPDGCRAVVKLKPDELELLLSAPSLSFQLIPFSSDRPAAADVPLAGLKEALKDMLP